MKGFKCFKRGEKGFTLVELLIVVAILGILAAVVIPNVVGLMGRGGKQAYETDAKTVQLAAATFYSDTHEGWWDNDDVDVTNNVWGCTDGNETIAGHYYPTAIASVNGHVLFLSTTDFDPNQPNSAVILEATADAAEDADITAHAMWMGLLVNDYDAAYDDPAGITDRWAISPLDGEDSLYLNELPKSAMTGDNFNGDPGTGKSGGYCWVVGKNGLVFGAYKVTTVDPTGALPSGDYWFSGYAGAYP